MRSLRVDREFQRRQARRAMGLPPFGGRLIVPQARGAALGPELLALPQTVDELDPIQDVATGTLTFVHGFSAWGGDDPHG